MLNLLHVLPAFADADELRLNVIVSNMTINEYELITETGHLKLDRVGYSSLAYPLLLPVPGMKTATRLMWRSLASPRPWCPAPWWRPASSAS